MDIVDDDAPVPMKDESRIFAKVSRLGLSGVLTAPAAPGVTTKPDAVRVAPEDQKLTTRQEEVNLINHDEPSVERKPNPVPQRRNSDKLLSFDDNDIPTPAPAAAASFGGDFLDFSTTASTSSPMVCGPPVRTICSMWDSVTILIILSCCHRASPVLLWA